MKTFAQLVASMQCAIENYKIHEWVKEHLDMGGGKFLEPAMLRFGLEWLAIKFEGQQKEMIELRKTIDSLRRELETTRSERDIWKSKFTTTIPALTPEESKEFLQRLYGIDTRPSVEHTQEEPCAEPPSHQQQ